MESNPEKSYTISLNSFEDDNIRNIREEIDSTVSGLSYKYISIYYIQWRQSRLKTTSAKFDFEATRPLI